MVNKTLLKDFDTPEHRAVKSEDGSYTAYSQAFDEHYHSTKDGALNESLFKHVYPALHHCRGRDELWILDICFGLGFNTLATLHALRESDIKINILSPEFDESLVRSLKDFHYPELFADFQPIVESISAKGHYHSEQINIEVYLGDAREFLRTTSHQFDIVYQDAFSPDTNPVLWTKEYFHDIAAQMKKDAILTTYSTALKTRIALEENGLLVYLNQGEGFRNATVASKMPLKSYEKVDVAHKLACNPGVTSLRDTDIMA